MNWLAHVLLSEEGPEFRLGNMLADLVKGRDRDRMSDEFRRGIRCHQRIDAFTDYHAVVMESRHRIRPGLGRYAGILVDIFFDHVLAREWSNYCGVPLEAFTSRVYTLLGDRLEALPVDAARASRRIIGERRLDSYQTVDGIHVTLDRLSWYLSRRWQRKVSLQDAVGDLVQHAQAFSDDFARFFPDLVRHVESQHQLGWPLGSVTSSRLSTSPT